MGWDFKENAFLQLNKFRTVLTAKMNTVFAERNFVQRKLWTARDFRKIEAYPMPTTGLLRF